jgi:transposase InsO family protein
VDLEVLGEIINGRTVHVYVDQLRDLVVGQPPDDSAFGPHFGPPRLTELPYLREELVTPRWPWRTVEQLEYALFEYLDWWNHRRPHSEIRMIPPVEKEANHYAQPPAFTRPVPNEPSPYRI